MIDHPYSWCGEKLIDHARLATEIFERCLEQSTVTGLRVKLGLKLPVDSLKLLAKLVIILHDAGKAHPYYQRGFKHDCVNPQRKCSECENKPRFFSHEIFSSYTAFSLIMNLPIKFWYVTDERERQFLTRLVALTILEHHQASRRLEDILNVSVNAEPWKHEYTDDLLSLLPEMEWDMRRRVQYEDGKEPREIARNLLHWLSEAQIEYRNQLKLYCLLLGPLCICDNVSARLSRPSKRMTPFVCEACFALRDLREYLKPECSRRGFAPCRLTET